MPNPSLVLTLKMRRVVNQKSTSINAGSGNGIPFRTAGLNCDRRTAPIAIRLNAGPRLCTRFIFVGTPSSPTVTLTMTEYGLCGVLSSISWIDLIFVTRALIAFRICASDVDVQE